MLGRSHVLEVVLDDVVPLLVLNCVSRIWVRVHVVLGVGEEPGGGLRGGVQDDVVACVVWETSSRICPQYIHMVRVRRLKYSAEQWCLVSVLAAER